MEIISRQLLPAHIVFHDMFTCHRVYYFLIIIIQWLSVAKSNICHWYKVKVSRSVMSAQDATVSQCWCVLRTLLRADPQGTKLDDRQRGGVTHPLDQGEDSCVCVCGVRNWALGVLGLVRRTPPGALGLWGVPIAYRQRECGTWLPCYRTGAFKSAFFKYQQLYLIWNPCPTKIKKQTSDTKYACRYSAELLL